MVILERKTLFLVSSGLDLEGKFACDYIRDKFFEWGCGHWTLMHMMYKGDVDGWTIIWIHGWMNFGNTVFVSKYALNVSLHFQIYI